MILHLDDKIVRETLLCLNVPTGLACFVDDGQIPSPSTLLAVCDKARHLQTLLEPAGGEIASADRGFIVFTNVFPADIYAVLVSASRQLAAKIDPMMDGLGALQPHIPVLEHITYELKRDGTRIWMHFRDLLVVQWQKLGRDPHSIQCMGSFYLEP